MPRRARKKSKTCIYHVMLRAINRQTIFEDDEDREKFLTVIHDCKKISGYELYAYCLMGNHVHLLIKEGKEELDQVFRRIGARYVYWYNYKYRRTGHLFQDRFKSEPVENDEYFLAVLRYIIQNPVKAGICGRIEEYEWSSIKEYKGGQGITDTDFALSMFGEEKSISEKQIMNYLKQDEKGSFLEDEDKRALTDAETEKKVNEICGAKGVAVFQGLSVLERDKKIALLKEAGLSIRQIVRLTGISFGIVRKAEHK